jgi:DNA-binding LytR/AlgR family response regulator
VAVETTAQPPSTVEATAIVAEDEKALLDKLCRDLRSLWPGLRIVATAADGVEALALFEKHRPQVMFLDIQMPGLTGLEVARQVHDQCHLVFITAYDSHAVAAFETEALDYVLKPYGPDRLGETVRRVQGRIDRSPPWIIEQLKAVAQSLRSEPHLTWVRVLDGAEVKLIMVSDVCYFRAETKYTTVATAEGEFIIRRSIKDLASELDPSLFWQVHRSTIVNVAMVGSVSRDLLGGMILKLKGRPERLPVSEAHRHMFRHM